jgi:hypothetical protein
MYDFPQVEVHNGNPGLQLEGRGLFVRSVAEKNGNDGKCNASWREWRLGRPEDDRRGSGLALDRHCSNTRGRLAPTGNPLTA